MKIIEQKITVEHKIKEFNELRAEIAQLLNFFSTDKREQGIKWKRICAFQELKVE